MSSVDQNPPALSELALKIKANPVQYIVKTGEQVKAELDGIPEGEETTISEASKESLCRLILTLKQLLKSKDKDFGYKLREIESDAAKKDRLKNGLGRLVMQTRRLSKVLPKDVVAAMVTVYPKLMG
ncbi:hypothetical protein EVJ58_g7261 [Rhodofomes roseus]|uniref:Uncharacterized protein n=1 Tax=Rhodofomes roseus TaxID=34475 RepID=A0A4Y9Y3J2_9APHY|nr:hypothetical protein EVJ58_g7261 [Rhodofomes roseus]